MSVRDKSILIVEDEKVIADVLDYNLRRAGFKTEVAFDGLSACRVVGKRRPDLVLLDIMLPDLDGWEICRLIRNHDDNDVASTPIVMLTALSSDSDRVRGARLGADAYVTKPYSLKKVVTLADEIISERRRTRARLQAAVKH